MPVAAVHNLTKQFGDRTLFSQINFSVEKGDKIGFIGANGAGKTTLFKILTGSEDATDGEVVKQGNISIGYLEQHVCADSSRTAYEETLTVFENLLKLKLEIEDINQRLVDKSSLNLINKQTELTEAFQTGGGLTFESRTAAVLSGLGFSADEIRLPVSALSGGQRSKIGLAKLLLCENDLILLDEPTNHLDIESVAWLEDFLISFKGAAVIISHDRFFLDRVTNKTMELECSKLYFTVGNYSKYKQLKAERVLSMQREYDNKRREIKRIEGIIEQQHRWNKERNIKTAESKQKQIDRIERGLVKPENEYHKINIEFKVAAQSGENVLNVLNERCDFGDSTLYKNVEFKIRRGDRVCLLGPNGAGKTTLLNRMLSKKYPENFQFGTGVTTGYFDQFQSKINNTLTPFDEVRNTYPQMTDTAVRNALAAFEFKGNDVFKSNADLSGGEKARVAICKLVLSGKNFLILDEPTNHLDLYSRKALEDALKQYNGTLLIVSHDRYFINNIANKVVWLESEKTFSVDGNYDDLLAFKQRVDALKTDNAPPKAETPKKGKELYLNQKKMQSEMRKRQTAVKRCETEISQLEKEQGEIKLQIEKNKSDYKELERLTDILEQTEQKLLKKIEEWEKLETSEFE